MGSVVPLNRFFNFEVVFEARQGGGLTAFSEDVPGFVLCGEDGEAVLRDAIPALQFILSKLFGSEVVVSECGDLRGQLVKKGLLPANESRPIHGRREYVVTEVSYEREALTA